MIRFTVKGVAPYDGVYDLDFADAFRYDEWRRINQLSGVRQGEFMDELDRGNAELVIALVVVAIERTGVRVPPKAEAFWQAKDDAFTVEEVATEAEEDARPPQSATKTGPDTEPSSSEKSDSRPSTSGGSTTNGGGNPESVPSPTGGPGSATSSIFPQ